MIMGLTTESHLQLVIYFPHPVLPAIFLVPSVTLLNLLALLVTHQVLQPLPNELARHLLTSMGQMFLCAKFTMGTQMVN